ncbi:DUF3995 domain-containing protein [Streptomyces decoyicus]|uniref:DUF3995 domain-containing protein n=1 Tax=Streptomyces decoyicus TaxID=249567 RepID=UPI003814E5BC
MFAGVHFYWAVGGEAGLSISAGPLATERPLWFVVAGLWGVGVFCLLGALLAWLLALSRLRGVPALLARWLGWGVSALLLAPGDRYRGAAADPHDAPGHLGERGAAGLDAGPLEPLVHRRRTGLRPRRPSLP